MATQTLTNFDAILKNVYRGPIVEQLNQESYAIDQFERVAANDMGTFSGKQVIFPIHTGRNRGRASITDGGTLPVAGTQSYADGYVTMRYFTQGIELSDQVIKQSETNEGAFVRAMTSEVEGATTDLRKDINRQVYGTGNGALSDVRSTVAALTSATSLNVTSTQYLAVGDSVDLVDSSGVVRAANVAITSVTASTGHDTTTGSGSIGFAATSTTTALTGGTVRLTSPASVVGSAYPVSESDGFRNITATTGALHQIDPANATSVNAAVPTWKGSEIDSSYGTTGLEDQFMRLAQTIRRSSAKSPDVILTTLGVQRRLSNQFTGQKRWQDAKSLKMQEGYSAIMIASGGDPIPVIADVDAPLGFAFALN
ncbi:MAG: phage major capsid protein, partial [Betaproteobacteria bacterium]|nr:phage major capsid protein [Betaproteobacteria bacterium]